MSIKLPSFLNRFMPKGEFGRNVLILMTGTTIAQAIPVAISPILTRIYTPEDFGLLALFVAITSIIGSVANARYELAIMLPEKDEDAINIFALGFSITIVLSLIVLLVVILFNGFLVKLFNNEKIGFWLYFAPLSVFFIGFFNVLTYFNNRLKNYKDIGNAAVVKSVIMSTGQLGIGNFKTGASGLIVGHMLAQTFANMRLLKNIIKYKHDLFRKINFVDMKKQAKRYSQFPKYSLWAVLANTLSGQVIMIFISQFFGAATLGFYSLTERALNMPISLMGKSFSQVFFQEAVRERQQTGTAKNTFNSTVKKLLMIGIPFFTVLFFVIEDLCAFVFGEKWRIVGVYAKICMPLFLARFVTSPVTVLPILYEKNRVDYLFQLGMLLLVLCTFGVGVLFHLTFINFLYVFSGVYCLYYIFYLVFLRSML